MQEGNSLSSTKGINKSFKITLVMYCFLCKQTFGTRKRCSKTSYKLQTFKQSFKVDKISNSK
ncbi:hypothetical protein Hanom_Chr10g00960241 [Helianthus anomalus]